MTNFSSALHNIVTTRRLNNSFMRANPLFRLVFLIDKENNLLVIRPIGRATGQEFLEKLFEAYQAVEAV